MHGLEDLLAPGGVAFRTYHPQSGRFKREPVVDYIRAAREQCPGHWGMVGAILCANLAVKCGLCRVYGEGFRKLKASGTGVAAGRTVL